MTIFGNRAFREVIMVKWGPMVGLKSDRSGILIGRGRDTGDLSIHTHREEAMWRQREKSTVYEPRKGVSPDANPDGTLILDF